MPLEKKARATIRCEERRPNPSIARQYVRYKAVLGYRRRRALAASLRSLIWAAVLFVVKVVASICCLGI
jgi:hypothetical protein